MTTPYPHATGRIGRTAAAALALAVLAAGTALADQTETRPLPPFHGVHMEGHGDLDIRVGGDQRVTLTADDLGKVETEVEDGILKIRQPTRRGWFSGDNDLDIEISVASLDEIKLSGSGDVEAEGIDADSFTLAVSGSGDAELSGRCTSAKLSMSGSGDIDARDLRAEDVVLSISGSGDASVHASGTLQVTVSGSGDVDVYGGPMVRQRVSGSGDITMHDDDDA
ncbi:hypothetical protein CCR85_00195 [Rhodothalassium salexigens]|uniref:head GIN domain-containing protein n=1 Tax=Rhodothalassium salexigens TaxID=1086 RepID=UPI0019132AA8|nr:head GIN domain-containing protein [Rhodothalassium salexigens]MBK5909913.1 hypothetical protein [Rhodothalassium salexigens]MBK5922006.1 hypothetical protein [Rhodothalassium salexigens]